MVSSVGNKQETDCTGRLLLIFVLQVAILIPFRNRHEHLPILFQHLIPILQRQRLQFAFYVIEQVGVKSFKGGGVLKLLYYFFIALIEAPASLTLSLTMCV